MQWNKVVTFGDIKTVGDIITMAEEIERDKSILGTDRVKFDINNGGAARNEDPVQSITIKGSGGGQ